MTILAPLAPIRLPEPTAYAGTLTEASVEAFFAPVEPFPLPGTQPQEAEVVEIRTTPICELAARRAEVLAQEIGDLTLALDSASRPLSDPVEIAQLLSSPGSERASMLVQRHASRDRIAALHHELRATERIAGRRIGAASLAGVVRFYRQGQTGPALAA
jgi:hypothetical protein